MLVLPEGRLPFLAYNKEVFVFFDFSYLGCPKAEFVFTVPVS